MAYQDLSQPMSLQGLSSLPDNIAMLSRARQRGFQAAANGDLTSSLSEGMATPNDDLLTEALTEQNAQVGNVKGVGGGPNGLGFGTAAAQQAPGDIVGNAPGMVNNPPLSIQGLQNDPIKTALENELTKKYPDRKRWTQGTTNSTPIEQ